MYISSCSGVGFIFPYLFGGHPDANDTRTMMAVVILDMCSTSHGAGAGSRSMRARPIVHIWLHVSLQATRPRPTTASLCHLSPCTSLPPSTLRLSAAFFDVLLKLVFRCAVRRRFPGRRIYFMAAASILCVRSLGLCAPIVAEVGSG